MEKHLVVGYGTLLYRESLATSMGEASATVPMRPVVVHGYKRLFNLRPDHYESSSRLTDRGIESAAANVEPCPGSSFNGLAFEASGDELATLDQRERYYLRCHAQIDDFTTGESLGEGYVYSAALDAEWIERDADKLLPLWRDIEWARLGAYAISQEFGAHYDRTTYLADGQTLMLDRYRPLLTSPGDS